MRRNASEMKIEKIFPFSLFVFRLFLVNVKVILVTSAERLFYFCKISCKSTETLIRFSSIGVYIDTDSNTGCQNRINENCWNRNVIVVVVASGPHQPFRIVSPDVYSWSSVCHHFHKFNLIEWTGQFSSFFSSAFYGRRLVDWNEENISQFNARCSVQCCHVGQVALNATRLNERENECVYVRTRKRKKNLLLLLCRFNGRSLVEIAKHKLMVNCNGKSKHTCVFLVVFRSIFFRLKNPYDCKR